LTWNPSTSPVAGYRIYRGSQSGGPYSLLNSGLEVQDTYLDLTVQAGASYYYVVTAVDSAGIESAFSNEAEAVVPSP